MKTIVLNFFIYFHFFVCSVAFLSFSSRIRHCSIDFFFICCTHCFNFSRLSALRRLRKTFTWSDRIDIFLFFTTKSPSTGGTTACVCVCVGCVDMNEVRIRLQSLVNRTGRKERQKQVPKDATDSSWIHMYRLIYKNNNFSYFFFLNQLLQSSARPTFHLSLDFSRHFSFI